MYFRICECGSYLDPGEICEECREKAASGAGTSESGNAKYDSDSVSQKVSFRNDKYQN